MLAPTLDQDTTFQQHLEDRTTQQFVAQLAIEALDTPLFYSESGSSTSSWFRLQATSMLRHSRMI